MSFSKPITLWYCTLCTAWKAWGIVLADVTPIDASDIVDCLGGIIDMAPVPELGHRESLGQKSDGWQQCIVWTKNWILLYSKNWA